ncbi:MAG: hypothetical protein OCC49_18015 [Fibrobacterales bacterium]
MSKNKNTIAEAKQTTEVELVSIDEKMPIKDYERFYDEELEAIQAIEKIYSSGMIADRYISEGESLFKVVDHTMDSLLTRGFDAPLQIQLIRRLGAARIANSNLKLSIEEGNAWSLKKPEAKELRDTLYDYLKFASHNKSEKMAILKNISKGFTISDMIQDLMDLSRMGENMTEELQELRYDITNLAKAKILSVELNGIRTAAQLDRYSKYRVICDQAITHLSETVEEIRRWARFVFKHDKKTLDTFLSEYKRKQYNSLKAKKKKIIDAQHNEGGPQDEQSDAS